MTEKGLRERFLSSTPPLLASARGMAAELGSLADREFQTRSEGVLGLFPAMGYIGGVQASGKVAWEGIAESSNSRLVNTYLFCYGKRAELSAWCSPTPAVVASSKFSALARAIRVRWPVGTILVWHLSLMKLLTFFRPKSAKVALFLHGIEAWRQQDRFSQALLRRVDLFLTNSDYTWWRFVRENPSFARFSHRTVYLGTESSLNENVPTPRMPPVTLMISRLLKSEDYKGHRELINTWPLVLQRIPEAELWIAGDGDLRTRLEQLVGERRLQGKVRFWGLVSEAKKLELLGHSRCLALPSRNEGFGLVYLEAMRLGRPCLVSTFDAGREVVNPPEAGLAVDPSNKDDLVTAVCRCLTGGPDWNALSQRARERYQAYFTAEHFKARLVNALNAMH